MARTNNTMPRYNKRKGSAKVFYGSSSGYVDLAQGSITIAPSDSFTIECWFKCVGNQDTKSLFGALYKSDSTSAIELHLSTGGILTPFIRDDNGNNNGVPSSGHASLNNNVWHHVALVCNGSNNILYLFVDGICRNGATGSAFTRTGNIVTAIDTFIGSRNNRGTPDQYCAITIDEFRWSNIARYAANFTPPDFNNPFVSDNNTVVLLHFEETGNPIDSSSSPKTVTVSGVVGNTTGYMVNGVLNRTVVT